MERIEKQPFIREEMRIPDVTNMDGLVSLMGRSMDNEESFHIDLLLASLSRMHPYRCGGRKRRDRRIGCAGSVFSS